MERDLIRREAFQEAIVEVTRAVGGASDPVLRDVFRALKALRDGIRIVPAMDAPVSYLKKAQRLADATGKGIVETPLGELKLIKQSRKAYGRLYLNNERISVRVARDLGLHQVRGRKR